MARCKGFTQMLRICTPCPPHATRAVPGCAALRRKCTAGTFLSASDPFGFEALANSTQKKDTRLRILYLARCKGFTQMLRICTPCPPHATRVVPGCAALRRKCAAGTFLSASDPFGFESLANSTQKKDTRLRILYLARCKGFEPLTFWFVAKHSIQLS